MFNKISRRYIGILISLILVFETTACGKKTDSLVTESELLNSNVTLTVNDKEDVVINSNNTGIEEGDIDDIYSMVCSHVENNLSILGFQCEPAIARTLENDDYAGLGVLYYSEEIDGLEDQRIKAAGFVEIVQDDYKFFDLAKEESIIIANPIQKESSDLEYVCLYNLGNIDSNHFVYQNKYVRYYQQAPMRIVYNVAENIESNYDLTLGSIYDYDNKEYIYDETIFSGEYQVHYGTIPFSDIDYKTLEEDLKRISEEQEKAGYRVEEYNIVYISSDSIKAYLDGQEEETFFGYSIDELTEEFGPGIALESTADGFKEARIISKDETYNWKSFIRKIELGGGLIIVGAVLAPITGGMPVSCALFCIGGLVIEQSTVSALHSIAVYTAEGIMEGKDVKTALMDSKYKGLDKFADTFYVCAAIDGVAVNATGIIRGPEVDWEITKKVMKSACRIAIGSKYVINEEDKADIYKSINNKTDKTKLAIGMIKKDLSKMLERLSTNIELIDHKEYVKTQNGETGDFKYMQLLPYVTTMK